jgi:hypothetical protein
MASSLRHRLLAYVFTDQLNQDRIQTFFNVANLMMEYGVGVSHRVIRIPKIDSDYFEE